eukprot:m.120151 g.120151  ORF g.120151 m.120151 type:complete len:50 (+) comp21831_c0_seq2:165-314(+)
MEPAPGVDGGFDILHCTSIPPASPPCRLITAQARLLQDLDARCFPPRIG